MKPANVEDIYELSPLQEGMLINSLIAPGSGNYVQQQIFGITGNIDLAAFEQAWQAVIERHPALRTAFHWKDLSKPVQVVQRDVRVSLQRLDWSGTCASGQKQSLENYLKNDIARGFELTHAPLMRFTIISLGQEEHQFIWSSHHILHDSWSSSIILSELMALYDAKSSGRTVVLDESRPFRDYIAWLRRQNLAASETYWRGALAGFRTPVTPGGRRSAVLSAGRINGVGAEDLQLSDDLTERLQSFARQRHLTISTLVHAAWAILLARYSRQDDVVFGMTVSGRPTELTGVEMIVGLFINTLPLRVQVDANAFMEKWLSQLQARQAESQQYHFTPLVHIQTWSELPRGERLFDSIVVFENIPLNRTITSGDTNATSRLRVYSGLYINWTEYPLSLLVNSGANLSLSLNYDRDQFEASTARRFLTQLHTLLEGMLRDCGNRLRDLPWLNAGEREQLLFGWNATETLYAGEFGLHDLVRQSALDHANALALISDEERLTYLELNIRANRLGNYLREKGVKTGAVVGICLERSANVVVAMLAILKAGGAYLPLDPSYPSERLNQILSQAQPVLVITESRFSGLFGEASQSISLCLDAESPAILACSNRELPVFKTDALPAYVIFTSGSTGRPKGVVNLHAGVVNRLRWMQQKYRVHPGDAVLQKTPFGFDVSVWEIFLPLISGARLVLARPGGQREPQYLAKLIAQESVTIIHFVPSMLRPFLDTPAVAAYSESLRYVICSGEELTPDDQRRFVEVFPSVELYNLYGPTEAAIDVTYFKCGKEELARTRIPIGKPIANTQVYILDREMEPVSIGAVGELYLGGVQLALGYLNRPDLTAQAFLPDPHSGRSGQRLYRTGDLARFLDDGNIEFLGRVDGQVKIRGHRIELGEIETVLRTHDEVRQAAVIVRERNGDKQLVGYVVLQAGGSAEPAQLRSFVRNKLPEYMTPATIVAIGELPLNSNGKLDRERLPNPDEARQELAHEEPRSELERAVAGVWSEVLGMSRVGIRENFFDLGGHSLLVLRVHTRLQEILKREVPVLWLFQYPTIDSLVQQLAGNEDRKPHDAARVSDEKLEQGIDRLEKLFRRANKPSSGGPKVNKAVSTS